MEKIRLLVFSLCLCAVGNNLVLAQSTLPVSLEEISIPTASLIVRSSPHSDYITLELPQSIQAVSFEIYGMDGKEVYQGRINGTQLIEVSTWPSGTYFVICGMQREKLIVSK